jgi:hypothetical protein
MTVWVALFAVLVFRGGGVFGGAAHAEQRA